MPTVLRFDGLRVVIYPNDHPSAHVHVVGPGTVVVIDLPSGRIREAIGATEQEARWILRRVLQHRNELLQAWKRIHG
ncbi:MAG: DUF4160 domain-containing protein [Alphaproteobacteria bacterium]|nr:DUF4160 domain-containing protein [Alphaproteobacteria bacterium]